MNNYRHELHIAAPALEIYRHLTTPEGVRAWWTTDCSVGPGIGEVVEVRFGATRKRFRIERLEPGALVEWFCTDAHLHAPGIVRNPGEWKGTTIRFVLEPLEPRRTALRLEHVGLTRDAECFDICSQGWSQFLESLKELAETGVGRPYRSPLALSN